METFGPESRTNGAGGLLPIEILRLVFQSLEASGFRTYINSFRLVCKLFNEIAVEYLYRDLILPLNYDENTPPAVDSLLNENHSGFRHVSRIALLGFLDKHERRKKRVNRYSQQSKDISRVMLDRLLQAFQPGQLISFVLAGRDIPDRIQKISPRLLFDRQQHLRHLCIPMSLLLKPGDNASDTLGVLPHLRSLYLTDFEYIRSVGDLWALIAGSASSLVSLVLRSSEGSELGEFLTWDRNIIGDRIGLPRTELALPRLQDIYLEGIPRVGKFLQDCAPYLIDFASLRMLRLEKCPKSDDLLRDICNATRMPKLKSLQLFETCTAETFAIIVPALAPLETLAFTLDWRQPEIDSHLIKDYHAKTLRRLWLDHKSGNHRHRDMLNLRQNPYSWDGAFFPLGWPALEELAINPPPRGYMTCIPENVRICRLIGSSIQDKCARWHPYSPTLHNLARFETEKPESRSKLSVVALGVLEASDWARASMRPYVYLVRSPKYGEVVSLGAAETSNVKEVTQRIPGSHILWYDRMDAPWSDRNGSLWF